MKRLCFFLIVTCHFAGAAGAQENKERWLLGTGIMYCSHINSPGVNLNVTYRLIGDFHIGPDFSALLTRERNENGTIVKQKELEYNLNAQNLFDVNEHLSIYPLAGIKWSKLTTHREGEKANVTWVTALNSGGGLELRMKIVRLFFETKWVSRLNKLDVTTGVVLQL